jgi:CHAD domain-containing protein
MIERLANYYQEHKSVFEKNFQVVLAEFEVEAIHKMRTSTKRLRALLQLIEYLSPDKFKAKKQLKKIRQLFKYAGKIREIQIEMITLANYAALLKINFPEYHEYLKYRERKEIARFLRALPEIDKSGKILDDKYILEVIQNISLKKLTKNLQGFIELKKQTLLDLNKLQITNPRIHENRTHIKQLYYLYDHLTELSGQKEILKMKKEKMREIEQMIGSWHDLVNSGPLLKAFFKIKGFKKNDKYNTLRKSLITDRKKKLKEITGVLTSVGLKANKQLPKSKSKSH